MKAGIIFATALVAVFAWDSSSKPCCPGISYECEDCVERIPSVAPCKRPKDPSIYLVNSWRTPIDPTRNSTSDPRDTAKRLAYLLSNYTTHGQDYGFRPQTPHVIPFQKTPAVKKDVVLGLMTTVSNYTMTVDLFMPASMDGLYNFTFRAADAGIVQVGSPSGECEESFEDFINPEVLFEGFDSRWSVSRQIPLKGGNIYPIRITVTNLFYASGMYLVVRDPRGNIVRFGKDNGDDTSIIWPEETAGTHNAGYLASSPSCKRT